MASKICACASIAAYDAAIAHPCVRVTLHTALFHSFFPHALAERKEYMYQHCVGGSRSVTASNKTVLALIRLSSAGHHFRFFLCPFPSFHQKPNQAKKEGRFECLGRKRRRFLTSSETIPVGPLIEGGPLVPLSRSRGDGLAFALLILLLRE